MTVTISKSTMQQLATAARRGDNKALGDALQALALGGGFASGAGSPNGSLTPDRLGEFYHDTVSGNFYRANGLNNTDWIAQGLFDPNQQVHLYDDFLGDTIRAEWAIKAGSGSNNAVALSAGEGGRLEIKSASDDGTVSANTSTWDSGGLDWRADSGGLVMEARLQIDDISEAYCFVGFTDALANSTLNLPIFLVTTAIDSDAANACGVCYDVDGDTEEWFHGGVAGNTDTTPVYSGATPTEGLYETIRVEVSAAGAVRGFIDGVPIGDEVASAITITTPIVPIIISSNRSGNVVNVLVDYVAVWADRSGV